MIPTMNQVSESIIVWRYFEALGSGTGILNCTSKFYKRMQNICELLKQYGSSNTTMSEKRYHILEWLRQNPNLSFTEMLCHDLKTVQATDPKCELKRFARDKLSNYLQEWLAEHLAEIADPEGDGIGY